MTFAVLLGAELLAAGGGLLAVGTLGWPRRRSPPPARCAFSVVRPRGQ